MNNFDIGSKKYTIILFAIFIAFVLVIIKAFDYIPEEQEVQNPANVNQALLQNYQAQQNVQEESDEQTADEKTEKKELNIDLRNDIDIPKEVEQMESTPTEKLEPLEENSAKVSVEQGVESRFTLAQKYRDEKQYIKALEEYKQIAESESDVHIQARCYEEIANVYGIVKRYGTALSFAQKAYNMEPTTNREMLLSRLYYKTGDLDKATKRMNNVLKREFSDD